MSLTVVTGGTRSGKSAHAERLALATGAPVTYVATADDGDPLMADRIAAHRAQRPAAWPTLVATDDLASVLRAGTAGVPPGAGCVPPDGRRVPPDGRRVPPEGRCILLDGLGVWIAGVMHRAGAFDAQGVSDSGHPSAPIRHASARKLVHAGITALLAADADVIVVAETAGEGVLPADPGSRDWLDLLGRATQQLSAAADHAVHVVAGRPLTLHGAPVLPDAATLRHHGDRDVRPTDADHAVNVVAGGPPPWLRAALDAALDTTDRYPDDTMARQALARLHGRRPDEVVPVNGAVEALWLLGPALRPRLAAVVHPAFTEAEAALRAHGVPLVRVLRDPERDFALDPAQVPDEADLVILGNPASPSGTLDRADTIRRLLRPGRTVVVDEAFMSLVPGEPQSLAADTDGDLIVVRSLTKILSIPGLRVGYALAPPAIARRLIAARPPWSASTLALAVLTVAARHPEELAARAQQADAERADLQQRLTDAGIRTWPANANFCLVAVDDGPATVVRLRKAGIAVRPAHTFPGLDHRHLRLTARDPQANARLVRALTPQGVSDRGHPSALIGHATRRDSA